MDAWADQRGYERAASAVPANSVSAMQTRAVAEAVRAERKAIIEALRTAGGWDGELTMKEAIAVILARAEESGQ